MEVTGHLAGVSSLLTCGDLRISSDDQMGTVLYMNHLASPSYLTFFLKKNFFIYWLFKKKNILLYRWPQTCDPSDSDTRIL